MPQGATNPYAQLGRSGAEGSELAPKRDQGMHLVPERQPEVQRLMHVKGQQLPFLPPSTYLFDTLLMRELFERLEDYTHHERKTVHVFVLRRTIARLLDCF